MVASADATAGGGIKYSAWGTSVSKLIEERVHTARSIATLRQQQCSRRTVSRAFACRWQPGRPMRCSRLPLGASDRLSTSIAHDGARKPCARKKSAACAAARLLGCVPAVFASRRRADEFNKQTRLSVLQDMQPSPKATKPRGSWARRALNSGSVRNQASCWTANSAVSAGLTNNYMPRGVAR